MRKLYFAAVIAGTLGLASNAFAAATTTSPVHHPIHKSSISIHNGEKLYVGKVSNVTADSFILTEKNGRTYTVNFGADTVVWNKARKAIMLSQIQSGDSVRLDGTLSGDTITAAIVRDMSKRG